MRKNVLKRIWNAIFNRYDASKHSYERGWRPPNLQTARFDVTSATRETLVSKAMDLEADNPLFNRCCDIFEQYTSGFTYEPNSSDKEWNKRAKKWWQDEFAKHPCINSRHPLSVVEGLIAREFFVKGEGWISFAAGESGIPRLQLWESQQIKTPPGEDNNPRVVDGIRIDENGRPVSYYIRTEQKDGKEIFLPRSADSMVHIFEPSRPNQMRGIPFATPSINVLQDLADLEKLEMQAAKQAAEIAIVQKNADGEVDADEWVRNGGTSSQATDADRIDYYANSIGAGTRVIKNGDSLEQFRTDRPSVVTIQYWMKKEAQACAGMGIPHVLVFPESMQGTVYRGALDMADSFFKARSQVLISAFRRIYEYEMSFARFRVPELANAPEDWREVNIFSPRSINVDVGYTASATIQGLSAGLTDYAAEYGKKGEDWKAAFDRLGEQQAYAESKGLRLQVGQMMPEQDLAARSNAPKDKDSE